MSGPHQNPHQHPHQHLLWLRSPPGLIGLLCLVAGAVLALGWAPDWRSEAAQAEAEQRLLQRQQRRAVLADAEATATATAHTAHPQAQALAWWQALPPAQATPGRLADLIERALRAGLVVQGTRQDEPEQSPGASAGLAGDPGAAGMASRNAASGPNRISVLAQPLAMRLSGSYLALRRFVAEALQADPALALNQLSAARASAEDSSLAVELQWTLLARLGVPGVGVSDPPAPGQPSPGLPARPARPAGLTDWPAPPALALAAWRPPPAAVPPPASSPEPVAVPPPAPPRLPYQWLGVLDDGQQPRALLGGTRRANGLAVGEVLDQRWRLDRIGAAQLDFTYLPTGQRVGLGAAGALPARAPDATEPDNT